MKNHVASKKEFLRLADDYAIKIVYDGESDPACFVAEADELPGMMGYGKTREAAIKDWKNWMSDWYDAATEGNIPIRYPVSESEKASYSGRVTVRMSESMHRLLSEKAEEEAVTVNGLIVQTLRSRILREQTPTVRLARKSAASKKKALTK
ncbi:hypothetical protein BH09SUM1_BH09SUM1_08350 [soil metagenome]